MASSTPSRRAKRIIHELTPIDDDFVVLETPPLKMLRNSGKNISKIASVEAKPRNVDCLASAYGGGNSIHRLIGTDMLDHNSNGIARIVTPNDSNGDSSSGTDSANDADDNNDDNDELPHDKTMARNLKSRRALFQVSSPTPLATAPTVTSADLTECIEHPIAKRRLLFGRVAQSSVISCQNNVKTVYRIIQRLTGTMGGNGSQGPIYGELTMGSMQKMVNLMKQHAGLDKQSKFIDVGSGIGKPNLHVAQDPGVQFSCGIEMEHDRWRLGMSCLHGVLQAACEQQQLSEVNGKVISINNNDEYDTIHHKCYFLHGNIMAAKVFDPFTHVYMFSIGFPPPLWHSLAETWNKSTSSMYLICFHAPESIIDKYGFNVRLVAKTSTSLRMHGSKEGHTGYIYARNDAKQKQRRTAANKCDPVFAESHKMVTRGTLESLWEFVDTKINEQNEFGPSKTTRSAARQRGLILSKT